MDLWSVWREIGCQSTTQAVSASNKLHSDLPPDQMSAILKTEAQHGIAALVAFAAAVDGFYEVIKQEFGPHPEEET